MDDDELSGNGFEHDMSPTHINRSGPEIFQFARNEGPTEGVVPPPWWVTDDFDEFEEPPLGPLATFVERKRGSFAKNSVLRLLDCDWTPLYSTCGRFGEVWKRLHDPGYVWVEGYKVLGSPVTGYKLYFNEKLCVPTGFGSKIVAAQHISSGHLGVNRLLKDLRVKYEFGHEPPMREMATKIKQMCTICQACEQPNWSLKGPLHMTSVLPRALTSICVDIFTITPTTWMGENYDCMIVTVDRLSGFVTTIPTHKID